MQTRLMTIVFIDVQGFTKRNATQTLDDTKLFIQETQAFVRENVEKYSGKLVKTIGDGFLSTFDGPTNAIQAALEIQRKLEARNSNIMNPDNFVRFRIGINTGEIAVDESNDVFGDPVNIAARIESFCEPNEVFISEATYLAINRNQFPIKDLGPQMFKNATREVRIYKVMRHGQEMAGASTKTPAAGAGKPNVNASTGPSSTGKPMWQIALGIVGILLFLVVAVKALKRGSGQIHPQVPTIDGGQNLPPALVLPSLGGKGPIQPPKVIPILQPGETLPTTASSAKPADPDDDEEIDHTASGGETLPGNKRHGFFARLKGFKQDMQTRATVEALVKQGKMEEATLLADAKLQEMEKSGSRVDPGTYIAVGNLMVKAGKNGKAREILERACKLYPRNPRLPEILQKLPRQ